MLLPTILRRAAQLGKAAISTAANAATSTIKSLAGAFSSIGNLLIAKASNRPAPRADNSMVTDLIAKIRENERRNKAASTIQRFINERRSALKVKLVSLTTALNQGIKYYVLNITDQSDQIHAPQDVRRYMQAVRPILLRLLKNKIGHGKKIGLGIKAHYSFVTTMNNHETVRERHEQFHHTNMRLVTEGTDMSAWIDDRADELVEKVAKMLANGSADTLTRISQVTLNVVEYRAHRAAIYLPLPDHIANKKACINVQNKDNKCFAYTLALGLFHNEIKSCAEAAKRPYLLSTYVDRLDLKGVEFPVSLSDIPRIERMNDCAIHVLSLIHI